MSKKGYHKITITAQLWGRYKNKSIDITCSANDCPMPTSFAIHDDVIVKSGSGRNRHRMYHTLCAISKNIPYE